MIITSESGRGGLPTQTMTARVLIVDDEPGLAKLYETWLTEDYETTVATDGDVALDAIHDGVDAVLLDRQMPGLSGDEVLTRMRTDGHDAPVALVTAAKPDPETLFLAFDRYLQKPIDRAAIERCVTTLVSLRSLDPPTRACQRALTKRLLVDTMARGDRDEALRTALDETVERTAEACDTPLAPLFDDERLAALPSALRTQLRPKPNR